MRDAEQMSAMCRCESWISVGACEAAFVGGTWCARACCSGALVLHDATMHSRDPTFLPDGLGHVGLPKPSGYDAGYLPSTFESCLMGMTGTAVPTRSFEFAMVVLVHNEASWLPEWLEYHILVGAEHFFIYSDRSTDRLSTAVAPYRAAGLVTLHAIPEACSRPGHEVQVLSSWGRAGSASDSEGLAGQEDQSIGGVRHCFTAYHFPQQVAMVNHARLYYAARCKWMAFRLCSSVLLHLLQRAETYSKRQNQTEAAPLLCATSAMQALLMQRAAQLRAKAATLLVSVPRSGSTLLGEVAFGVREDHLYVYEPCRQFPKEFFHRRTTGSEDPGGLLHGSACARFAMDVLSCRIDVTGFS